MKVLITGAGSGQGAAIATRLVLSGARVDDPDGHATLAMACDVTQAPQGVKALDTLRERWGGLINNAGTDVTASIEAVDRGVWTRVIETHLIGPDTETSWP